MRTAADLGRRFRARATALPARLDFLAAPLAGGTAASLDPKVRLEETGLARLSGPTPPPLPLLPRRTTVVKTSAAGEEPAEGGEAIPPPNHLIAANEGDKRDSPRRPPPIPRVGRGGTPPRTSRVGGGF